MKPLIVCAGLLLASATLFAQQDAPKSPPASPQAKAAPKKPPASPSAKAEATIGGNAITVTYSAPGVKGREGKLFTKDGRISKDPHYPVWRAGANSATTLHTDGDLMIGDLHVPKGDYTLFVDISDPDQWTLIVNKKLGEWGLAYDGSQDLGKTKMTMSKPASMVENLLYTLEDDGGGKGKLILAWEDHSASVPIIVHK
jgi:hypothetical protein